MSVQIRGFQRVLVNKEATSFEINQYNMMNINIYVKNSSNTNSGFTT